VGGADKIIDRLTEKIKDAEGGFVLVFSEKKFPRSIKLDWVANDGSGNIYHCKKFNLRGWLCPALFEYFSEAPETIYVQALPR
jgi:hypothetical protein